MVKRVSNIGLAVRDAIATADTYCKFFGFKKVKELAVPEGGVAKSILLWTGNCYIEIMEPMEGDFPLKKFVEKRGEGLYQITLVVDDVDKEAQELENKGARLNKWTLDKEKGITVAYLHPKSTSGVVFELITEEMLDQWEVPRQA